MIETDSLADTGRNLKAFLLATVSLVALTSVARTSELPGDIAPFSSTPAAGWRVGHIGSEGGTPDSDSLTKNVTGPVGLRLHPDSSLRMQPTHDSAPRRPRASRISTEDPHCLMPLAGPARVGLLSPSRSITTTAKLALGTPNVLSSSV